MTPPWRMSCAWRDGRERVLEPDLGLVAAAQHRALADRRTPCPARGRARARRSSRGSTSRRAAGSSRAAACMPVASAAASARRRRPLVGARRRSRSALRDDPQQEQVEHGEEAELQRDGDRLEHAHSHLEVERRRCRASTRSPGCSGSRAARRAAVDADAVGRAEVGDRPAAAARARSRRGGARRWSRRARRRSRGCGRSTRRRGRSRALALGDEHARPRRAAARSCELLLRARSAAE